VDIFNDPGQALSNYKPDYYDLVITDIRMPQMTGFDLARQIWLKDANARICFTSSFEIYEAEARKVFPSLKNFCFIKKPIMPSALAKHIQMHFAEA
jgi:two-component SAPR family response regulator